MTQPYNDDAPLFKHEDAQKVSSQFGNTDNSFNNAPKPEPQPQPQPISFTNSFSQPSLVSHAQADHLVTVAWRWAVATIILFSPLAFWSVPAAAKVSFKLQRNDVHGAHQESEKVKNLGIASIIVAAIIFILWFISIIAIGAASTV